MKKGKDPKRYDLSTAFMQSLVDQDSERTVKILTHCSDADLKKLAQTMLAVTTMLLGHAVRRGIDVSEESRIVIEAPDNPDNGEEPS